MKKIQINTLPEYEDVLDYYWVYEDGQIWSDYKQNFMKPYKHYNSNILRDQWKNHQLIKEPYYVELVGLRRHWKEQPTLFPIHRIVATAFVPNPQHLSEVNHKDKNTSNNHYTNLEWIDKKENIQLGLSKKVWRCDIKTHERIESFNSTIEAEKAGYGCQQNISAVCLGKRKSAYGFFWEYEN